MIDTSDLYPTDYKALEDFVISNPELEVLEAHLSSFNLFEAIGMIQQELRHSDFLSFLLEPQQNHGLGDAFVTRFLQHAIRSVPRNALPISPIDLDLWGMDHINVLREWQNIDLLLLDADHRFVVIIENKIGSKEHSRQLERYYETVERTYTGWKILALYLTPDGDPPQEDERYIACSYADVANVCEELLQRRSSTMGSDVQVLIHHYIQMLRRHIVSDSPIAQLCREIYQKHKRALDLIYEYRPDRQDEIRRFLVSLISERKGLILDHSTKSYVYFLSEEWDFLELRVSEGMTPSRRILLFNFENYADRLYLRLSVGPGPEDLRERLLQLTQKDQVFKSKTTKFGAKFHSIYTNPFITAKSDAGLELDELQTLIRKKWNAFLEQDLPKINAVISKKNW